MYSKISAPMKSCLTLLTLASIVLKALGQNYPSSSRLSEDFVDTSRIAVRTSIQCFRYKQIIYRYYYKDITEILKKNQ